MSEQTQAFAIFGHHGDTGSHCFGRMLKLLWNAVDEYLTLRRDATGAEQAFEQLGPAGSHQAGDAKYFAPMQSKIDVTQAPAA